MDVFIARQPIFDRNLNIYGYELLYRQNANNYFTGVDDDQATSELIDNTFMVMGLNNLTDGTRAFINFSKKLIETDVALLLPKHNIVIEIVERGETTQSTIDACKKLKSMGYKFALDDFVLSENSLPLIEIADIIKIEFSNVNHKEQVNLIKKYKSKIKFLAEKVETREEYEKASDMGYDFFQGYFFSKPSMISAKEIVTLNVNLFSIIEELNKPEPRYYIIAEIIQRDLGLSYKLLKLVNTVYMGARHYIKSIRQALSYLGINRIYQWITLIMLKDLQNIENAELIKVSLIRGKLMELLARELKLHEKNSEYFFTGIFSFIDVLLNKKMESILEDLPISLNAKQALMGYDNEQLKLLNFIMKFENEQWDTIEKEYPLNKIGASKFMDLYILALKWANKLNY